MSTSGQISRSDPQNITLSVLEWFPLVKSVITGNVVRKQLLIHMMINTNTMFLFFIKARYLSGCKMAMYRSTATAKWLHKIAQYIPMADACRIMQTVWISAILFPPIWEATTSGKWTTPNKMSATAIEDMKNFVAKDKWNLYLFNVKRTTPFPANMITICRLMRIPRTNSHHFLRVSCLSSMLHKSFSSCQFQYTSIEQSISKYIL